MLGRLINIFQAELAQLDTQATAEGPPGYDPIFKEPRVVIDATGARSIGRKEKTVRLPCQIETNTFDQMRMTPEGNAPKAQTTIIFHYRSLRELGMIDENNRPRINVNDRLSAILDRSGENVMQRFPNPPGLYIVELTPSGFGFGGGVNLLVARFGDRAQAKPAG